ncbi:amphi-Trp domain-containing protein [Nitrincola iocasae]|jgi:amphi-Trp domain-containing protein|uniref:Amphi-Trp domain-containing protein n=1 Tax=Nitrincola iocasae TaxID=2614693 RepID=A0A5J6LIU9_9GAMM|nr:amphi-Trp domain-containing protein [Nitrincola iocasae]QEW08232.1 amphi-Trp domain-containing protein [Nitrincola iocasae]
MSKKRTFHHESLQEPAQLVKILQALIDGLEKGNIKLDDGSGKIRLQPEGLLNLDLQAIKEAGVNKLNVKVTWRDKSQKKTTADKDPLKIS